VLINIQFHADRVDLAILTAQSQNVEYTMERPDSSLSVPAPHLPSRIERMCLECSFFAGTLINQPIISRRPAGEGKLFQLFSTLPRIH
jgi:hypothetical protein